MQERVIMLYLACSLVTTLTRCIWKEARCVVIEVVCFHFRALNISNSLWGSLSVFFVVVLFTLDRFQASGLAQVMSTLQADALSMLALQHDAQRPYGLTDEVFLALGPLYGAYTFVEPSTLRSCKELFPFLSLTPGCFLTLIDLLGCLSPSFLTMQEMSAPPCCFSALGGAWSCMLMTLLTPL